MKEAAAKAAEEEFKAIAEEVKADAPKGPDFSNKRKLRLYLEEKWVNQNFSWIKLIDSQNQF